MATKNQASTDANQQQEADESSLEWQTFAEGLPEHVLTVCTAFRDSYISFQSDTKAELVAAYQALGTLDLEQRVSHSFTDYCRAIGYNYRTAHSIVRRALGQSALAPAEAAPPKQEDSMPMHTAPSVEGDAPHAAIPTLDAAAPPAAQPEEPPPLLTETRDPYADQTLVGVTLQMSQTDVARLEAIRAANGCESRTRTVLFLMTEYEQRESTRRAQHEEDVV